MAQTDAQSRRLSGDHPEVSETLRVPAAMMTYLLETTPALMRRRVAKGQALYSQGELSNQVFVVLSGRISITMLRADGQEFLIDIVGAGALCGEGAAFDGLPRFSNAAAMEAAEVLVIPAPDFCALIASDAKFATAVVHTIALKQRTLACRLAQVTQASPEVRITELLSQITSTESPAIMLTHQQIANLIGASRITVTRAMQRLRRAGTVQCRRGHYQLVRAPRAVARGSSETTAGA